MGLPPFRWMGFFGALSALSYIERMGEGKCLEIIKILKKNDLKKCSFMRRIFYPVKFHPDIAPHKSLLFPRATSQVSMLAWILGDCREDQIPRCFAALQV